MLDGPGRPLTQRERLEHDDGDDGDRHVVGKHFVTARHEAPRRRTGEPVDGGLPMDRLRR